MYVYLTSSYGTGETYEGVVSSNGTSSGCGSSTLSFGAYPLEIDNNSNQLLLDVRTEAFNDTTTIAGAKIHYKLQVSDPPVTATFTDVPTNHPFFRFVEALAAAGVTGGYPDGRFGVDDPITRGQMAVFLSSALGLNWP